MPYAITFACVVLAMLALWGVSVRTRDVSIVDVFWGPGFVGVAWLSLGLAEEVSPRGLLVAGLVSVWGLRLGAYIGWRKWGEPEDFRYAAMRERHGERFARISLLTVFGLQALLLWFVSLPLQVAARSPEPAHWTTWDGLGVALWSVGLFFEAVGDWQLARFKAEPENEGRVLDRGLWRYTRHPNYFGDFLVWWGFFAIALATPAGIWTVASPLLMSFLLLRVSGVALLEKSLRKRRPEYQRYVERTNAFFPGPPKPGARGS